MFICTKIDTININEKEREREIKEGKNQSHGLHEITTKNLSFQK